MTARRRRPARCLALLARLSAYIDGELGPKPCRAIEAHCRGCARCAVMVSGLRRTVALCRASAERRLPPRVRARAKARIARLLMELPTER